jgi:hypothetical protein
VGPIFHPAVVNGGRVESEPLQTLPRHGLDVPDIAFGAQTTLAYAETNTDTSGTLTVSDGRHAGGIALLVNYMAGSLVAVADGATLVTEAQTERQPLLPHPLHG